MFKFVCRQNKQLHLSEWTYNSEYIHIHIHIHHLSLLHSQSGLYNRLHCINLLHPQSQIITPPLKQNVLQSKPTFMPNKTKQNKSNQINLSLARSPSQPSPCFSSFFLRFFRFVLTARNSSFHLSMASSSPISSSNGPYIIAIRSIRFIPSFNMSNSDSVSSLWPFL